MAYTGYTGALMERELFGITEKKVPLQNYVKYKEALNIVKRSQPFNDPSHPKPKFANDLVETVAKLLQLNKKGDLSFFTAVGSLLDKWHGVDAIIEWQDEKGKKSIVTLDVTTNPAKGEEHKADIVFSVPKDGLDPNLDADDYKIKVEEVASQVTEQLKLRKAAI